MKQPKLLVITLGLLVLAGCITVPPAPEVIVVTATAPRPRKTPTRPPVRNENPMDQLCSDHGYCFHYSSETNGYHHINVAKGFMLSYMVMDGTTMWGYIVDFSDPEFIDTEMAADAVFYWTLANDISMVEMDWIESLEQDAWEDSEYTGYAEKFDCRGSLCCNVDIEEGAMQTICALDY